MKFVYWILAIGYLILPRDLLPDMARPFGWIDDVIVLYLVWRFFGNPLKYFRQARQPGGARSRRSEYTRPENHSRKTTNEDQRKKTPWEVLGVSPNASKTEIKAAYRELAGKYHPDKVEHLGKDFQEMANQRFQEIQAAYDKLMR